APRCPVQPGTSSHPGYEKSRSYPPNLGNERSAMQKRLFVEVDRPFDRRLRRLDRRNLTAVALRLMRFSSTRRTKNRQVQTPHQLQNPGRAAKSWHHTIG